MARGKDWLLPDLLSGRGNDAIPMTGYDRQFSPNTPVDGRNKVLFTFDSLPDVHFSDYMNWHIILNRIHYPEGSDTATHVEEVSNYIGRLVLKPSWKRSDWLRASLKGAVSVQAHTESLDLTRANEIWCRNKDAKRTLAARGFDEERILIRRKIPG